MVGLFSRSITVSTFFMRRLTWRVFALYIMNPTFEGSRHDFSLALHS